MKRIAAYGLIVLMLMPSLVCAMPVCPHAGQAPQVADHSHCVEQADSAPSETLMLFADCLSVDLQLPTQLPQIAEPTLSPDQHAYASLPFWAALSAEYPQSPAIRGSPPGSLNTLSPYKPIYLTTQRFRI